MYIDTHCHLNFPQFDPDRAMVIGNAKKAGVKKFIVPGVDHNSCRTAVLLAQKNPEVIFAAVGYHPYEATKNPDVSYLESLLLSSRPPSRDPVFMEKNGFRVKPGMTNTIIAIGECGLDYHIYKGEIAGGRKEVQHQLLEKQLHVAIAHNLPVIIHCRDAYEDIFAIIRQLPKIPRGVFHCFSSGLQDLRIAKEMGFYFGIDGNVTYSKQLSLIVPSIPLSRLVLETDAPYLTPHPHRGERNEPKYIPLIAQKIAELQNKTIAEIMETTTTNAKSLFGI